VVTSDTASATTFPSSMTETPWALIFDDGVEGVTVLDPNDPAGGEGIPIEGQRRGDQPYRLELVAGHLVVGWNQVYAVDLDTAESTLLGEATVFVPGAEPDRVWHSAEARENRRCLNSQCWRPWRR
jgi:hypothetical protein